LGFAGREPGGDCSQRSRAVSFTLNFFSRVQGFLEQLGFAGREPGGDFSEHLQAVPFILNLFSRVQGFFEQLGFAGRDLGGDCNKFTRSVPFILNGLSILKRLLNPDSILIAEQLPLCLSFCFLLPILTSRPKFFG